MVKLFNSRPAIILIAEDNDADVYLTKEALADATVDTKVYRVKDGLEALKFLRKESPYVDMPRPDLMLLDLNMPIMDGRQVMEQMKNDQVLRAIPVVVLTTSQSEEDIINSYSLKANCYITKPMDFEQFRKVVRSIEHFWFSTVSLPDYSS